MQPCMCVCGGEGSEVWIQAYTNSFNKYLLSMYVLCWKYRSEQKVKKKKKVAPMGAERKDTSCDQLISPLLEAPSLSCFQGPTPSWFSSDLTASLHLFSVFHNVIQVHGLKFCLQVDHSRRCTSSLDPFLSARFNV